LVGVDAFPVEVEIDIGAGMPPHRLVGLAEGAVKESLDRVKSALKNSGFEFPHRKMTINLAPADTRKEGSAFDLPLALGILAAQNVLKDRARLREYLVLGELALDGRIKGIRGALPTALLARSGKFAGVILPRENASEASVVGKGTAVLGVESLREAFEFLEGLRPLESTATDLTAVFGAAGKYDVDFSEVKGQEQAKRALEVAAAGGHNLLMVGPPGSGKSMLAARLPGILPPLEPAEALELGMLQSVAAGLRGGGLLRERPFRDPHHSASTPALVGGGIKGRPGEVSLAHLGVLFLDELPEFNRAALEALRQPLESGRASVARVNAHVTYPARVQLVAAMNPCRCGHLMEPSRACGRAPRCGLDYQGKLSGPLLDRIDLCIDVPPVSSADLALPPPAESSTDVAARVAAARAVQRERLEECDRKGKLLAVEADETAGLLADRVRNWSKPRCNADTDGAVLAAIAEPDAEGRALLTRAAERLGLSARAWHRTLRVARTLADLDGADSVRRLHIAEALSYRRPQPRQAMAA